MAYIPSHIRETISTRTEKLSIAPIRKGLSWAYSLCLKIRAVEVEPELSCGVGSACGFSLDCGSSSCHSWWWVAGLAWQPHSSSWRLSITSLHWLPSIAFVSFHLEKRLFQRESAASRLSGFVTGLSCNRGTGSRRWWIKILYIQVWLKPTCSRCTTSKRAFRKIQRSASRIFGLHLSKNVCPYHECVPHKSWGSPKAEGESSSFFPAVSFQASITSCRMNWWPLEI